MSTQQYYEILDGKVKQIPVYYDIGHYPDEGCTVIVRAEVYNSGTSVEKGKVVFFAKREGSSEEIKIGEAVYNGLNPLCSKSFGLLFK